MSLKISVWWQILPCHFVKERKTVGTCRIGKQRQIMCLIPWNVFELWGIYMYLLIEKTVKHLLYSSKYNKWFTTVELIERRQPLCHLNSVAEVWSQITSCSRLKHNSCRLFWENVASHRSRQWILICTVKPAIRPLW